jgi:Ribosome-associated heat shock protein implicated in the recycling of the 50S subunit (S4 paralog)
MSDRHRIDTWLKYVCLFKHRTAATDACKGGHVKINGQRAKPAAVIREGDVIEYYHGDRFRRVVVQGIPESQQAKELARSMYLDESPPVEVIDRTATILRDRGAGRPTKRERREIERFKR